MEAKYDKIGIGYNQTRKPDPYLLSRLKHHLNPLAGRVYLDIGCGTGNYTVMLAHADYQFVGIDPSHEMLEKARMHESLIDWKIGHAEQIPFPDHHFDGIVASLTIHHWKNLSLAFQELHRVLKPQGHFVLFTATPTQMEGYWLNHYFPKMLRDSIIQMPAFEAVTHAFSQAKLMLHNTEKYFIKPDLEDLFLYAGKHRPSLYLNPQVRKGISSFSALANLEEVTIGLKNLEEDIATGKIDQIINTYENDTGDYLFMTARKS